MRPRPGFAPRTGRLGPRFALGCSRRFFGLRSFPAVSSVACGRIEFVSQPSWAAVLRTILSFPVAHHTASPRCSYLPLVAGKHRHRGTSTLLCTLSLKRTGTGLWPVGFGVSPKPSLRGDVLKPVRREAAGTQAGGVGETPVPIGRFSRPARRFQSHDFSAQYGKQFDAQCVGS